MPSSINWKNIQPSIYLALILDPHSHTGNLFINNDKEYLSVLSNNHIRRHIFLVLLPID